MNYQIKSVVFITLTYKNSYDIREIDFIKAFIKAFTLYL